MTRRLPERSWRTLLGSLIGGADLTSDDTEWAMDEVMSGRATSAQIAGYVVALRAKGETAAEIAGMAAGMLGHATRVDVAGDAVDVVGTGGDQSGSVNISTMTALVTAAAGVPVVKHGNRSASSKCGSADVLEALGVALSLAPHAVRTCVAELGIGFCFAPRFHPALRHAGPTRSELGIPTAFNVLGPLTNPAQPGAGLVGCAHERLAPVIAEVFAGRGASALVVRGDDGLDEITTTTTTTAWVVSGGTVRRTSIDPATLDIPYAQTADLVGGDAEVNAAVVRDLVGGKRGPVRDAVLINSAAAIAAYRGLHGTLGADLTAELSAGVDQGARAIDSGAAADLLARWAVRSTELAAQQP